MDEFPKLYPSANSFRRGKQDEGDSESRASVSEADTYSRRGSRKNSISSAHRLPQVGDDIDDQDQESKRRKAKYAEAYTR